MLVVYSTHCPRCNVLVKRLDSLGKEYTLVDDENEVVKVAENYGISEAPFAIKDGRCYTFTEIMSNMEDL